MNAIDFSVLNLQETRRRSIKLWKGLPDDWLQWKPDQQAMSFGEMIRHTWRGSYGYHMILKYGNSSSIPEQASLPDEPILSVKREIELSIPYFNNFIEFVSSLTSEDLTTRLIDRSEVGYQRYLGDMLARIAYHDAVHAGQFLQYMRMVGIERPNIWD